MTDHLADLHRSLDQRWRPEDVLNVIVSHDRNALPPSLNVRVSGSRRPHWSSMSSDFVRPVGAEKVLASVAKATQSPTPTVDPDDAAAVRSVAIQVGKPLGWAPDQEVAGANSHLTREQRAAAGIELSRRKYNRQWRAVRRLNRKADRLATEQEKRDLVVIGRSGFTSRITVDRFRADPAAAHFIAYWAARKNVRRQFSLNGRHNPMDEVANALLNRCLANPLTDWEMIAWVRPTPDVLAQLTDEQKGALLGQWVAVLRRCATLLEQAWDPKTDRSAMIVRRGQDSSTWNTIAQAYNAARAAWLTCITAMNATDMLAAACPGKVMRLMAADLAYWHRSAGGGVDPNTAVWAALPPPWDVLNGHAPCPAVRVERACKAAGLDPQDSGWTAPRPAGGVAPFALTPELVHGVTVADPAWASLLRRAGVFSGKHLSNDAGLRAAALHGVTNGVVVSALPDGVSAGEDW